MRKVLVLAGAAVVCLATVSAQQPPAQHPTFRTAVDLVNFAVMVVDKQGKPVRGLTADDFEIVENGKKQSVKYFAEGNPDEAPPLHLGLLLDTSGSMSEDLRDARSAAIKFVNALDGAADFTLVDFDTQVRVARFPAADYPRLVVYLDGAQQQDCQKVLVVYTDGGDTTSTLTFHDMLDLVKASDATVYAVGYTEHQGSGRLQVRADLERLATSTGGLAYFPTAAKDLDGVFDKIREEIGARYSLGYVSTDARTDGAWRGVDIKLLRRDLKGVKLRTRGGYFAPYKQSR